MSPRTRRPARSDAVAAHGVAGLTDRLSPSDDHVAEGFGFGWYGDFPFPAFHAAQSASWARRGITPMLVRRIGKPGERDIRLSLPTLRCRQICGDGARVAWGEEALFDLVADDRGWRIDCCPGPDWRGGLPTGFYATVAALACAWRGDAALHCSAVAWRGRALLIGGAAGAGKSTSVVAMLAAGARLIGDDLSVVGRLPDGQQRRYRVWRGRPDIRVHPANLALIELAEAPRLARDKSGKWLARPTQACPDDSVPLGAVMVIGGPMHGRLRGEVAAASLQRLLFRPVLQRAMPTARSITADILGMAADVPVARMASPRNFSADDLLRYGRAMLDFADSLIEPHAIAPPHQKLGIDGS